MASVSRAISDTVLNLALPVESNSASPMAHIFVPKGTKVVVGLLEANCNPEICGPDARQWKPERWLAEKPQTLKNISMPGIYSDM